jgi:threonine/homoserine/homoserine lactone efflux protein
MGSGGFLFSERRHSIGTAHLIQGLVLGFSIAAPVGQIGVLCIRRTLADGRGFGLASGLGAATADMMYGGVAAFGLTFISGLLLSQQLWLRLLGGLFLCYLGVRTFTSLPPENSAPASGRGLLGAYVSTFLLTLANPTTILSFTAIFAGFGIAGEVRDYGSSALLVLGVFLGSAFWWLILSGVVGMLRSRVTRRALVWVNRASGLTIAGMGVASLVSLFV